MPLNETASHREAVLSILDLARLDTAPLRRDPFDFVVVDAFLRAESVAGLIDDFPRLEGAGSYPAGRLHCGPSFARLVAELEDAPLRRAIEDKFAIDLAGRPTMVTVRGFSDGKDGFIHTDSTTKLITLLLYLNPAWEADGGRLRLLHRAEDLADCAAEVSPLAGSMVAFRRSDTSFHGHYPHKGVRRVIQLNWVTDAAVVRRELGRHAWSARLKALNPFANSA
jgi:SM-20-related protein